MKQFLAKNVKYGNIDFICQCVDNQLLLTAVCERGKIEVAILADDVSFPRIALNKTKAYVINTSRASRFNFPMQIIVPKVTIDGKRPDKRSLEELTDSLICQLFRAYAIQHSELYWIVGDSSPSDFYFDHGRQRVRLPIPHYQVMTNHWRFTFASNHLLIGINSGGEITPKVLQQFGIDLNRIAVGFEVQPGPFNIDHQCVVLENVAGLDSPHRPLLLNVKPNEYFFTVTTLESLNPNLRFADPTDILFCQPRQDEPIKTVETPYGTFKVRLAKSHSFYVVVE